MEKKDFPFLIENEKELTFGLRRGTYNVLKNLNNYKSFESEQEIIDCLKGKSRMELFRVRGLGLGYYQEICNWIDSKCN